MGLNGRLADRRVLVVEDEWFVASYLRDALESAGAAVIGPVPSRAEALALIEGAPPPDAATLNIRLEDGDSLPVAERLRRMGVPFVFLSATAGVDLPPAFRLTPRLAKPFAAFQVVELIERLVALAPANERQPFSSPASWSPAPWPGAGRGLGAAPLPIAPSPPCWSESYCSPRFPPPALAPDPRTSPLGSTRARRPASGGMSGSTCSSMSMLLARLNGRGRDQVRRAYSLLSASAASVHSAPDRRYAPAATSPNRLDSSSAASGANPAPSSQARSEVSAAPV